MTIETQASSSARISRNSHLARAEHQTAVPPQYRQTIENYLRQIGVVSSADMEKRFNVVHELLEMSKGYSVEDRAILMSIAEQESTFRSEAKNPASSARGVFQIINATWHGLGMTGENPLDSTSNIAAGLKLYNENLNTLERRFSDKMSGGEKLIEMYTLHHDGPSGRDYGGRELAKQRVLPMFRKWQELLPKLDQQARQK